MWITLWITQDNLGYKMSIIVDNPTNIGGKTHNECGKFVVRDT